MILPWLPPFPVTKSDAGHWVTIHGTHVYIEGGKITKGPDEMVGKKPDEVGGGGKKKPAKNKPTGRGDTKNGMEDLPPVPPGHARLYRAHGDEGYFGAGSHWSEEPGVAQAYTDNPGFGGTKISYSDVPRENILDLKGERGFRAIASAIADDVKAADLGSLPRGLQRALGDMMRTADVENLSELRTNDIADVLDEWWGGRGYDHPYQVWENEQWVRDILAEGYDWIRHDFEDFPPGAVTWRKLTDLPRHEAKPFPAPSSPKSA